MQFSTGLSSSYRPAIVNGTMIERTKKLIRVHGRGYDEKNPDLFLFIYASRAVWSDVTAGGAEAV